MRLIQFLDDASAVCVGEVGPDGRQVRRLDGAASMYERANAAIAAEVFHCGMSFLADPWGFFCPEVPIFRNREVTSSIVLRLGRPTGDPVKAFIDLAPHDIQRLCSRDLPNLPFAEDWLQTVDPRVKRPFVYQDTKRNWALWTLYELERRLRGQR